MGHPHASPKSGPHARPKGCPHPIPKGSPHATPKGRPRTGPRDRRHRTFPSAPMGIVAPPWRMAATRPGRMDFALSRP